MDKLVDRPRGGRRRRHPAARSPRTSAAVAKAKGEQPRGRHRRACSTGRGTRQLVEEIRATGARIKFISDGDVAGAIMAARPDTGIDLLLGIGGTPEGIIAACAMKCLGGVIQGRLWPDGRRGAAAGHRRRPRPRRGAVAPTTWSRGDDCFFVATGITDGELLRGRPLPRRRRDHPLAGDALRSGTIRSIESRAPARASCAPTARSTSAARRERPRERGRARSSSVRRSSTSSAALTATSPSTPVAARPTSPSAWPGWGTRCPCARASAPTSGAR